MNFVSFSYYFLNFCIYFLFIEKSNCFHFGQTKITTSSSNRYCIDKKFKDLAPPTVDPDDTWRTKPSTIIPIEKPTKFTTKSQIITFDAYNTLIEPSQSIGRWYREALHIVCDTRIRLPRPQLFTVAFKKAYSDM